MDAISDSDGDCQCRYAVSELWLVPIHVVKISSMGLTRWFIVFL